MFETALFIPARSQFGPRVLPAAIAAHLLAGSAVFLANSWRVDALPEPLERIVFASFAERLPAPEEPRPVAPRPERGASKAPSEQALVEPREPETTPVISQATLEAEIPVAPDFPVADTGGHGTTSDGTAASDDSSASGDGGGDGGGNGEFVRYHAGIQRPEAILRVEPAYTEAARRACIQGYLILDLYVDERGNVARVDVLKGLPMGLTEAAVDAARRWRFRPAERSGRAIPIVYSVTVNFSLS